MQMFEAGQIVIDLMQFPPELAATPSSATTSGCAAVHSADSSKFKDEGKRKVTLKQKECRCLLAQLHKVDNSKQSKVLVAELFSPPCFPKLLNLWGKRFWHMTRNKDATS